LRVFLWDALDALDKFHDIEQQLSNENYAADCEQAKVMIEDHKKLSRKITTSPIHQLDKQGQKLLKRINGSALNCDSDSGFSGSTGGAGLSGNADFQSAAPRIHSLNEKLHETYQELKTMWQNKKVKLEQCYHLCVFQLDANKMFDWIKQNHLHFVSSCTEIGSNQREAIDLQENHRNFTTNSMNVYMNVHRVMLHAHRMLESGHYAADDIRAISNSLDCDWKHFAYSLDKRRSVFCV